ncbi:MAG: MBL fold metallo-hydrolase [Blastocatellia bacterium AA13]|nr:MAG: MBL fold metallo-hydrolase [Blastocatellia bacterium AA13]
MRITFLGTGTSVGVPSIGCGCATCTSNDPRDNRLRTSVLVTEDGRNILIDASTDFRQQALRTGITKLDAILFTHAHADHCFGLDDVRPIMMRTGPLACYATETTWEGLRRVYEYAFVPGGYSAKPRIEPHTISGAFNVSGIDIEPIEVIHGELPVTAFRIGEFAYVTDCNHISDEACERLSGLDLLVIDALRIKAHPTHLTLAGALAYIERLAPRRALLTHISHDINHSEHESRLPARVNIAYDGLVVEAAR